MAIRIRSWEVRERSRSEGLAAATLVEGSGAGRLGPRRVVVAIGEAGARPITAVVARAGAARSDRGADVADARYLVGRVILAPERVAGGARGRGDVHGSVRAEADGVVAGVVGPGPEVPTWANELPGRRRPGPFERLV